MSWQRISPIAVVVTVALGTGFASAIGAAGGEPPAIAWERGFGRGNAWGKAVVPTRDGGYAVAGWQETSREDRGLYLVKTNARGELIWQTTVGTTPMDRGEALCLDPDGGFVVAGATESSAAPGWQDAYLINTDAAGNVVWQRAFDVSGDDVAYGVLAGVDGGYLVAGETWSSQNHADVFLLQTDAAGNALWQKTFGGPEDERGFQLAKASDGGYLIVGVTTAGQNRNQALLLHTDAWGNLLWRRSFGGSGYDWGLGLAATADGGVLVTGQTDSWGHGDNDVYLIKTDAAGNLIWQRNFGGFSDDGGAAVLPTPDGGCLIAGKTRSYGAGCNDGYVLRICPDGQLRWQQTFGGSADDFGFALCPAADGGFGVAGTFRAADVHQFTQMALLKFDAEPAPAEPLFARGDANTDGRINLTDAVVILRWLFLSAALLPCPDAADANDDGRINVSDAAAALAMLFAGGPPLPPPFPTAGRDPTEDTLSCPPSP